MTKPASELIALADERAELMAKNAAATSWGAAVGARHERIQEIDRLLVANQSGSERPGVDACPHPIDSRHGSGSANSDGSGHSEWSCSKCGHHERIDFPPRATPPAQPAPAATHGKPDGAVRLHDWLASKNTVGPNECGYFTAGIDIPSTDIFGRPDTHYNAIEFHSKDKATAEARRDDALAALHSPKIAATETGPAEAKSQEPEAVAYRSRLIAGVSEPGEWNYYDGTPISHRRYETQPLYTHPTTKPEAPAVGVDAIAGIIDPVAFDPISLSDNHPGWEHRRETARETATAIAAIIAGGR